MLFFFQNGLLFVNCAIRESKLDPDILNYKVYFATFVFSFHFHLPLSIFDPLVLVFFPLLLSFTFPSASVFKYLTLIFL